jgi:hypothetical protein
VLADAAWNEIVANDHWPSTLRASFQLLADDPEAVVASWSVAALLKGEATTGEPAREVVHGPMTAFVRQLVEDLAVGASNTMTGLRAAIEKHGLTDKNTMAVRRKEATKDLVRMSRTSIPPDRFRSVNNGFREGDREPFLELIAEAFEPGKAAAALVRQGTDPEIAAKLASQPSASIVWRLLVTHMALEWSAAHGIENAGLTRVHNDFVDIEYAVVAWACGGEYVTEDRRAHRRFEEVLGLCDRLWP